MGYCQAGTELANTIRSSRNCCDCRWAQCKQMMLAQSLQCIERVEKVLYMNKCFFKDVIRTQIFTTDINTF
jgi:hypothetical protein